MNIPFHLAVRHARLRKLAYRLSVPWLTRRTLTTTTLDLHYIGFSGQRDFLEQVASLRSFLFHAGIPREITIVSDGTHTTSQKRVLESICQHLRLIPLSDFADRVLPKSVGAYANRMGMGKKLVVMTSLRVKGPTLYADSDVLFFSGARTIVELSNSTNQRPHYLLDCWPSFDQRLIAPDDPLDLPVNAGLLFFQRPLSWVKPLRRFEENVGTDPQFFSEQTVVHLAVRADGGVPLDSSRFIMRNEDQWRYRDEYVDERTAARHYISSFRHKMWLQVSWV